MQKLRNAKCKKLHARWSTRKDAEAFFSLAVQKSVALFEGGGGGVGGGGG